MKLRSIKKIFLLILVPMVFILFAQDRSVGNGEQSQPTGETTQATRLPGNGKIPLIAFAGQDVVSLAIDPINPSILYASLDLGVDYTYGMFKSEDGGASWRSIQGDISKKNRFLLIIDPHHPSTIFAVGMNKLFKSGDRGNTWREILSIMRGFSRIVFDPITPGVLYAGCKDGIYKSRDNGENWRCIYKDPNFNTYYGFRLDYFLQMHPFTHCLIGTGYNYRYYGGSDDEYGFGGYMGSNDCGEHWEDYNESRKSNWMEWNYVDPTNPDCIYSNENGYNDREKGLWRSLDGGKIWSLISKDLNDVWVRASLVMDPNFPNQLYVGGWDGLYASFDGGVHWELYGLNDICVKHLDFAGRTSRLYISTDRGLYLLGQLPNKNFPVIDIIQPQNQQMVYGIVPIQVEARDDEGLARVELFVNNKKLDERLCSGKSVSLSFDWDTRSFAAGHYDIFVNAVDDEGREGGCSIRVNLRNVLMHLQCQKVIDRALSAKKKYAILTTEVQNPGNVAVAQYVLFHWEAGNRWGKVDKRFTDVDLVNGKLTWKEPITEATRTCEYRVDAIDAASILIGQSNPVTVTGD